MDSLTSFNMFIWVNQSIPAIDNQMQSYKQDGRDLDREEVKRVLRLELINEVKRGWQFR